MYQQLPEFVRRDPKAYWFLSAMQAGAGIAGFMLFAFTGLTLLGPVGAILGIILFTKRQGVYNYEKILSLAQWFWLQLQEDELDARELYRTSVPSTGGGAVVVRGPRGQTIAIQPGGERR